MEEFIDKVNKNPKKDETPPPKMMILDDLLSKQFVEQPNIVEHIIPYGGCCIISGREGSMKSYVTEHIAYAVANGLWVFDHFKVEAGNVWIIDLENNDVETAKRMKSLLRSEQEDKNKVFFTFFEDFQKPFDVTKDDSVNSIIAGIKKEDIKLVIFDSFGDIQSVDEIDKRQMQTVFKQIKFIQKYNCAVLLIQHNRKGSDIGVPKIDTMFGSINIKAQADSVLMVDLDEDEKKLRFTQAKYRYGEKLKTFEVRYSFGDKTEFIYLGESNSNKKELSNLNSVKNMF